MAKENAGKIAIGVCSESGTLRIAKIQKIHKTFKLLTVKSFKLQQKPGSREFTDESDDNDQIDSSATEITSDDLTEELAEEGIETVKKAFDDTAIYIESLNMASEKGARIALSAAEPQIFYNVFDTDWDLKGNKLLKKVNAELGEIKEGFRSLKNDAVGLVKITGDRLMAVIRERDFTFLAQIEAVKQFIGHRLPPIAFTESIEISLINQAIDYHPPQDDVFTLILHVGDEYSRFIFLKGQEIFHISQIIGDGADSPNLQNTLYSRLLLELDTLELQKLEQIILTGQTYNAPIKEYFTDNLSYEVSIKPAHFDDLDISAIEPALKDRLGPYTVSIGTALRALTPRTKERYQIDLTPTRIKESQKRLSITAAGWVMLVLIPFIVIFTLFYIKQIGFEINQLKSQIYAKRLQNEQHIELEASIEKALVTLSGMEKSTAIIDSLTVDTETWSRFIKKLMYLSGKIGQIWFTDITKEKDHVILRGYAVYRNRISQLIKMLGVGELRTVDVHEIRDKTVFRFEIKTKIANE